MLFNSNVGRRKIIRTVVGGSLATTLAASPTHAQSNQRKIFKNDESISTLAFSDSTLYIGSGSSIYAFNIDSSDQQWVFNTDSAVTQQPVVSDEAVFVCSDSGILYAIDVENGSQRWAFRTGAESFSSPAVSEDSVFIANRDGYVYGIDIKSGDKKWSFLAGRRFMSSPEFADGTVFIGNLDHKLYAFNSSTGEQQWVFDTGGPIWSSPVVSGGTVFTGGNEDNLYAVDSETGEQQWVLETDSRMFDPLVSDGTVFVSNGDVYALSADTGDLKWVSRDEAGTTITVADDRVLVTNDRTAYTLSAKTGERNWSFEAKTDIYSKSFGDGTLFIGTRRIAWQENEGTVYAFSKTGDSVTGISQDGGREGSSNDGLFETIILATIGIIGSGSLFKAYRHITSTVENGSTNWDKDLGSSSSNEFNMKKSGETMIETDSTASKATEPGQTSTSLPIPDNIHSPKPQSIVYQDIKKGDSVGRGGNADVYRATVTTGTEPIEIAVKEPRANGTLHTETIERLLKEAHNWQELDDHDHIVSVIDYNSEPLPWIAMEYMDGGHLGERVGTLNLKQAVWTAIAISKAVRHAHGFGVAHLDLKPENVLFRSVGNAWDVPKVADWGLSKELLHNSKTINGVSPHYAAPEQFDEKRGEADKITDIYQLGAMFYELFTGRPPFEGSPTSVMNKVLSEEPTPPSEIADVPTELSEILLKALASEKDNRYEDVLLLRNDLQDLFDKL